jgi:hypothetical protein
VAGEPSNFDKFVRKWVYIHYETTPGSVDELRACEAQIGFRFPRLYVAAFLEHGTPVVAIELLSSICDGDVDDRDVSQFIAPTEIPGLMSEAHLGLPQGYVPIASDCMGNMFCFAAADGSLRQLNDAPIWMWDHDFEELEEIALSFNEWIARLIAIERTDRE